MTAMTRALQVGFLCLMFIGITFALDRSWSLHVKNSVIHAVAVGPDKTVADVLSDLYGSDWHRKCKWRIENGDFPYLEGWVYCDWNFIPCNDGVTNLSYAWQWDASWPSPRAITPLTARTFPFLDPRCPLTTDGRTALQTGKSAISRYFSARRPAATWSNPGADRDSERGSHEKHTVFSSSRSDSN